MDDTVHRYARQRLVPGWRQEDLASATVIVLGIGALGNEVAKNLALAGVGRMIVCDPDVVEESNLSRCVLFGPTDVGTAKAGAAATALTRLSPATVVEHRVDPLLRGVGLGELAEARVVLGCLDSRRARLELLGRCALVDASLVDGGTGSWSGEVRVRTSPDRGCYSCTLTPFERSETDIPRGCDDIMPPGQEPASIAITALTASWMTVTALRLAFGATIGYEAIRIEAQTGSAVPVTFPLDPTCPYHQTLPPVDLDLSVGPAATVRELLAALPDAIDVRGWVPVEVPSRCPRCGTPSPPTRAPATCAGCGSVVRPRTSLDLREADPDLSLREAGVAPMELLYISRSSGEHRWIRLAG
jgi:molybdopterin-synthase adenylyltransferase